MKPTESTAPAVRLRGFTGFSSRLTAVVTGLAGVVLATGLYRAIQEGGTLFPSGTTGWSLAVLTGMIVGHLVALGRERWWGGTGSGAALTIAVLLLYGWLPAALVSLAVVVLVGAARRNRWRQGLLHGAVDVLGIGAAGLVLAAFGVLPSVAHPGGPPNGASPPCPKSYLRPGPICSSPG